jgi:hypothetical protein
MKKGDEPMRGWKARMKVILLAMALLVAAAPMAAAAQKFVEFSVPGCQ